MVSADVRVLYGRLVRSGLPTLETRLYVPAGEPRGKVLLTTGFSEHIGRYEQICAPWQAAGFLVGVWELRGQGRSQGRRGYVEHFSDFVTDLFAVGEHFDQQPSWAAGGAPMLFAHSLGGLIALQAVLRSPARFSALLLSSPFLGLALPTPAWQKVVGRLVTRVWPTFSQPTWITGERLTRDAGRARAIDQDPLAVLRMTARLFSEIEVAQGEVLRRAGEITLPLHIRASGADTVVDVGVTRRFFDAVASPEKRLDLLADHRHELHQEADFAEHARACAEVFGRWSGAS